MATTTNETGAAMQLFNAGTSGKQLSLNPIENGTEATGPQLTLVRLGSSVKIKQAGSDLYLTAGESGGLTWAAPGNSKTQQWTFTDTTADTATTDSTPTGGTDTAAQKLALPFNNCTITAMYKEDSSPAYEHQWKSGMHFGLDMWGAPNPFYASGNGKVVGTGGASNTGVGYWIAIQYDNVYQWNMTNDSLKTLPSVIMRYFHLASQPKLAVGHDVTLDTEIGIYGNTGSLRAKGMKNHLHIEVDTNTASPGSTPTLGATDTTFDPCTVLFRKTSAPESQTVTYTPSYYEVDGIPRPYINEDKVNRLSSMKFD